MKLTQIEKIDKNMAKKGPRKAQGGPERPRKAR